MFKFMTSFSKFIGFVISNNVRVDTDFVYSKGVGSCCNICTISNMMVFLGSWYVRRGVEFEC